MSSVGSALGRYQGSVDARGLRVAVLVSRFNEDVTGRLLEGARIALAEHGASDQDVTVVHVPGAWELPQTAAKAASTGRFDAIVALGCVVRGETPHFEYVCSQVSLGLGAVARERGVPVTFGVLTTDDRAQALARAAEGPDNKGYEAALTAVEMVAVFRALGGAS